jgi:hypothetical protein
MESKEIDAFVALLMAYKNLWVEHATLKFVHSEQAGSETEAREHLEEMANAAVLPVSGALLAGTPLLASLQAALRTLPPH